MEVKCLEIRDEGTFIAALAVNMNPDSGPTDNRDMYNSQHYLLRRCGYPCDGRPNIILTRLDGNGLATNDPYAWQSGARTWLVAHRYIIDNWDTLNDGDVVDVQFINGEKTTKKLSERITAPL